MVRLAPESTPKAPAVLPLNALDGLGNVADGLLVGHRAEAGRCGRVTLVGVEETVGMVVLKVALDALGTEHALVEGELLPRLEADDLIVLDLELDAALLAAEAAVRVDDPVRFDATRS